MSSIPRARARGGYAESDYQAKVALMPGEMVLAGNEMKKIHEGTEAKDYRVCVKNEKDAASAKVTFDGKQL